MYMCASIIRNHLRYIIDIAATADLVQLMVPARISSAPSGWNKELMPSGEARNHIDSMMHVLIDVLFVIISLLYCIFGFTVVSIRLL